MPHSARLAMVELESAAPTLLAVPAQAAAEALRHWQRNFRALCSTQKEVFNSVADIPLQVEWLFARDSALTALEHKRWWGGCSVPQKAAEELLKTLQITSPVACFLAPSHPAQIAFALSRLKLEQAVIAILPRVQDLALTLHCHDFSADISSHRLWFTAGENWPQQLTDLFRSNPGLAIPQQFIRTALLSDDVSAPLITTAQKIFTDELTRRSELLSSLRQNRPAHHANRRPRITLAAPMRFRLWDDAGCVLRQMIQEHSDFDCTLINFDDAAHASPLALALAAAESDAILTANLTRSDCGQFLHPQVPLISWLTTRAIPAFDPSAEQDFLLLPDAHSIALARQSGWPSDRLARVPWPSIVSPTIGSTLAIIADTQAIDPNPAFDLSSHQLLWDLIRSELQTPIPINDISQYLHSRMKRLNVTDHGLDDRHFSEELIIPAYQQSIAAHLLNANIPLRIFGHGWREIPDFAPHAAGPISSRQELTEAMASTSALIHLWPTDHPHPIDTAGPPVIRLSSRGLAGLITDARRALAGKIIKPPAAVADAIDKTALARVFRAALAA